MEDRRSARIERKKKKKNRPFIEVVAIYLWHQEAAAETSIFHISPLDLCY